MNNILILNAGSTSLKCHLVQIASGKNSVPKILWRKNASGLSASTDYGNTLKKILADFPPEKISAIGHRVVHGGTEFVAPTKITPTMLKKLARYNSLAPLHNPANLACISAALKIFSDIPQVAVFDTAFFTNLPLVAQTYALPFAISKKYGYRRYGFHGLSHAAAADFAAHTLHRPLSRLRLITCHLGGGSSIAAISGGRPIDISLGWTPMEGLPMMTRCGDTDPGIILDLVEKLGLAKTRQILNSESGILGLSGCRDFLDLLKKSHLSVAAPASVLSAAPPSTPALAAIPSAADSPRAANPARLAFDLFVYRIKKYIGAYYAVLGSCDALVFTGAIGAGNPKTRETICANMSILKKTCVLSVPANEELQIARGAANFI